MPGYVAEWTYLENNLPVMIVARYKTEKGKTYRQFHKEKEQWVEGMPPSPYPLFGLNSLIQKSPFDAVLIYEGEKCAAVSHQLNWCGISPALGAQNTDRTDWSPLRHFTRFIILRDNDNAGVLFARSVSVQLHRICSNAEVFVVNMTPTIPGGDIIDWLQTTILLAQKWNGFDPIPDNHLSDISTALQNEINKKMVSAEDCPQVSFQPIEARFEGLPKPLTVKLPSVPSFPMDVFPSFIENFLKVTTDQFCQVPDFAATTFISSIGGLIGRSIHLKMRPNDSWVETTNNWSILVGLPSSKKSPIMRRVFTMFDGLKAEITKEFSEAEKEYKAAQLNAKRKKEECEELAPKLRRYLTNDCTTPKLRELMSENQRGLILQNDELKGQLERLEKTGSEGDRSFMMTCWSGLERYSEDRMCRGSLIDIPLALTWIGCIPPNALQYYLREAMSRNSGADGFMQRFQFVCFPDHRKDFELPSTSLSQENTIQIQELIKKLDKETLLSRTLSFNAEAQFEFDRWLIEHERDVRSGNHPVYWESHLGKQAKGLAVLVIVLHRLIETITNCQQDEVQLSTLAKAFRLLDYFKGNAYRCYNSVSNTTVEDAQIILNLLREKRLPSKFKAKEIYQIGLGGLSDSGRVKMALDLLQDDDWLINEKESSINGRNHDYWIVHPRAFNND